MVCGHVWRGRDQSPRQTDSSLLRALQRVPTATTIDRIAKRILTQKRPGRQTVVEY